MQRKNLFHGQDQQLHFVRNNGSRRMFTRVYHDTLERVSRKAGKIAPYFGYFSVSERPDYVQEAYRDLWAQLRDYRWVCDCGINFDTRSRFEEHGCCLAPKNTISQYATFVVCRRMKNYRRWHIRGLRDERLSRQVDKVDLLIDRIHYRTTGFCVVLNDIPIGNDPESLSIRKNANNTARDLLFFEPDERIKFVVESILDGNDIGETYLLGVDLGYFRSYSYAKSWTAKARIRGSFGVYAEALKG